MKTLTTALMLTVIATSGIGISYTALADEHGMKMSMREMHDGSYGKHHGSKCWRASLTEAQSKQVDQLRVDFKKKLYPLKAKIKQAKIDLALLVGTDKPSQKDIDNKIDAIAKMKAEKMRLKAAYQVSVRQVLTPEQRINFDMKLLKKANRDRKGYSHGMGHH